MGQGTSRVVGGAVLLILIAAVALSLRGADRGSGAPTGATDDGDPQAELTRADTRAGTGAPAGAGSGAGGDGGDDVPAPLPLHEFSGSVRSADGRALGGAIVHAEPVPVLPRAPESRTALEITADAEGAFDGCRLPAGDWALFVSAEGALRTFVTTVRVPQRERIDLVLPRGGLITGVVVDADTRAPVPRARVRLRGEEHIIGDTRAGHDGRFEIPLLSPLGRQDHFEIEAEGYASRPGDASVVRIDEDVRGRHDVRLVAVRGDTLSGRVVGPDGPVVGARVRVRMPSMYGVTDLVRVATTDAEGRFTLEHVQVDTVFSSFWISVSAPGFVVLDGRDPDVAPDGPPAETAFGPERDGWVVPDIRMRRRVPLTLCTIEGRVLDYDERPLAGVVLATLQRVGSVQTRSRADGTFRLVDVPTDPEAPWVEIAGALDGVDLGSDSVEIVPGGGVGDVELYLSVPSAPDRVRGRVADHSGAPVAGARVVVVAQRVEALLVFGGSGEPASGVESRTDSSGNFDVAVGAEDRVCVVVEAAGHATWSARFDGDELPEVIDVSLARPRSVSGRAVRVGTTSGVGGLDVALVRDMPTDERDSLDDVAPLRVRVVAVTAADGSFVADGVWPGDLVRVSGPGWMRREVPLDTFEHDVPHIELEPALGLGGRAAFADGHPAAGVLVACYDRDPGAASEPAGRRGRRGRRALVGAGPDGSFSCGPLPPGRYWLEFRGGSPQVVRQVEGPTEAGRSDVIVELVRGETIRGQVLLPGGAPAPGVVVSAAPEDRPGPVGESVSDRTGAFAIGGLDAGPYTITAVAPGCFPSVRAGARAADERIEIQLDEGLAVAGVVLHSDGSSFNFIELVAEPMEAAEPTESRYGATDVNGRFRITMLTRGRWRIRFVSDTYDEGLQNAVVVAGDESVELTTAPHPPETDDR